MPDYPYEQSGAYFITICTYRKRPVFGAVRGHKVHLSHAGRIAEAQLLHTAEIRAGVQLDEFVIMPNHLHTILLLHLGRGTMHRAPTKEAFGKPVAGSLATIIRCYKAAVTRVWRRKVGEKQVKVWQRNYFERVIRNEQELRRFRTYIRQNPWRWQDDRYFQGD